MHKYFIRSTTIITIVMLLVLSSMSTSVCADEQIIITNLHSENCVTATINNNEFKHEITRVPLFNQGDYPDVPYGDYGTVASHGCGITAVAMVATYMTNEFHSPADLALRFGNYNTEQGSYWSLFKNTAEALGFPFQEQTTSWSKVISALNNGQIVISIQSAGLFTDGGHFIVLTGITENGKIMVNDPNGWNWAKNKELIEGFAHGFTPDQITASGNTYWIYGPKNTD